MLTLLFQVHSLPDDGWLVKFLLYAFQSTVLWTMWNYMLILLRKKSLRSCCLVRILRIMLLSFPQVLSIHFWKVWCLVWTVNSLMSGEPNTISSSRSLAIAAKENSYSLKTQQILGDYFTYSAFFQMRNLFICAGIPEKWNRPPWECLYRWQKSTHYRTSMKLY